MKTLILKSSLFIGLVVLALNIYKATLPYYWGNSELSRKMSGLSISEDVNLVYFGPSAVNREFIPSVFEEELDSGGISAFNLGVGAMYYPEQDYLVRNFIEDQDMRSGIQYVLLFAQMPRPLNKHVHSVRVKYCIDWHNMSSGVRYFYHKNNFEQVVNYIMGYIENTLCVGEVFEMLMWRAGNFEIDQDNLEAKGYSSFELETHKEEKFNKRHKKFVRKQDGDEYMKSIHRKSQGGKGTKVGSDDQVVIDDQQYIDRMARQKGIDFIGVYSPDFDFYLKLKGLNSIYLGDSEDYQAYLSIENRMDRRHLNEEGAVIHTQRLARKMDEFLSESGSGPAKGRKIRKEKDNKEPSQERTNGKKGKKEKRNKKQKKQRQKKRRQK
ncbi:MAG: hypothetical protein R2813_03175 [Flavobacteriales bacterium]